MRLYNKPELLIALRNNLRQAGLSKGSITYTDLLPFDQNHYYGTQVLDLAVNQLNLDNNKSNENNSTWIIQIGSNLGGCARYLAGKYNLKVLAIELQNDLSQAASELTNRCGLANNIHHIAGEFLNVAEHLQENFYKGILSWITILHFTESDRIRLMKQSYRLLKQNGFFYCEDFIRIGNLTNEESQILEHDVYCRYLPNLDQYKDHLIQGGFQIIQTVDLTSQWKSFTSERLQEFRQNKSKLLQIHGEEIYNRLEYFYGSIVKLFLGENVGGVRIVAIKK
jgi:cyclopropane fatty-acyl-phospholipid synthase-like methyltransferase